MIVKKTEWKRNVLPFMLFIENNTAAKFTSKFKVAQSFLSTAQCYFADLTEKYKEPAKELTLKFSLLIIISNRKASLTQNQLFFDRGSILLFSVRHNFIGSVIIIIALGDILTLLRGVLDILIFIVINLF